MTTREPPTLVRQFNEGFKEHEAQPLLQGLTEKVSNPQVVLKEVLVWTSGQPFLTQKLCKLIRSSSSLYQPAMKSGLRTWCKPILESWQLQDQPEHLRTIRDQNCERQPAWLLKLYQKIYFKEKLFQLIV